ncbi:desulfoferrodoxin family protein [Acidaminococcus sp.]|jgi:superoxide reductase|uniref:Desulfoferrodoxin n=1 Tax=Acidaminococcus intestini TaxID=187327 RepID=A0A943I174_9FIRM|nr:desulfoferrodoxin family protein [Acidaminococcus sp.]MBS5519605.1 desulfoferrodoxin [Acidaminococcus intestini]MDY2739467.1 desulfoferrodoxin family protein [Acidaminococcus sp.]
MEQKFYRCSHCGKIIAVVKETGVPVICCGEKMQEIAPNTVDAAQEKHVPVIEVKENLVTVKVGSVAHPMIDEHYIEWISLETKEGNQRKELKPGADPVAVFALAPSDDVVAAYAYCNLHGLWKAEK